MNLKEFMEFLNIDDIQDKKIPKDYISTCSDNYSSLNDYIILNTTINKKEKFTIQFDTYISWNVSSSLGDGVISENYDFVEDLEIDVDLINIENYSTGDVIELDDVECINKTKKWIISILTNN